MFSPVSPSHHFVRLVPEQAIPKPSSGWGQMNHVRMFSQTWEWQPAVYPELIVLLTVTSHFVHFNFYVVEKTAYCQEFHPALSVIKYWLHWLIFIFFCPREKLLMAWINIIGLSIFHVLWSQNTSHVPRTNMQVILQMSRLPSFLL